MKALLKKLVRKVLAKPVEGKLRSLYRYWAIVRKLYLRNSAPIVVNTNHPLLTISSDDWGSIFLKSNDGWESAAKIKALSELLSWNKDACGHPAVLNAYITTGLPDFDSIEASGFKEYFFHPTYQDRPDIAKAWLDGHKAGVFQLGFHGRDHFNYTAWLKYLQCGNKYFLEGFRKKEVSYRGDGINIKGQMPELRYFAKEFIDGVTYPFNSISLAKQNQIVEDGVGAFENMFGFRPTIFVAPGCSFDNVSELTASDNNILYIETYLGHIMALDNKKKPILRCCHWGEKLAGSLISLIRNAHYEPAWQKSGRWGESDEKGITASQKFALIEIKRAFRRGEPCILSTHAQNYIGNHEKASLSLQGLGVILKKVVSRWPDVRYVSAEKLGALISGDKVDGNLKVNLYSKSKARKPQLVSSLFWTAYEFFFIMYVTRNSVPKTII